MSAFRGGGRRAVLALLTVIAALAVAGCSQQADTGTQGRTMAKPGELPPNFRGPVAGQPHPPGPTPVPHPGPVAGPH
jgi:hypothetical protein